MVKTIQDFLDDCALRGQSHHTIKWRRSVLNAFLIFLQEQDALALEDVTPRLIGRYLLHLQGRVGKWQGHPRKPVVPDGRLRPATVRAHLKVIKTFFRWCAALQLVDCDPAQDVRYKKPTRGIPQSLTHEEVLALLRAAAGLGIRALATLAFFIDTGCRISEVADLAVADLGLEQGVAKVRGKGRWRVTFFLEETGDALRLWLDSDERAHYVDTHPEDAKYVFLGKRGKLTYSGMRGILKQVGKQAGVKFHPHQLRHTFTAFLLEDGTSLAVVSQLLGHASVKTTADIYGKLDVHRLKRQHSQHSPLRQFLDEDSGDIPLLSVL